MNAKRELFAATGVVILLVLWRSRKHFKQPAIRNTETDADSYTMESDDAYSDDSSRSSTSESSMSSMYDERRVS